MTTETPPPPRRNWHFARWFIVFVIAMLGWSGWQAYSFRAALKQAEALGWRLEYTDPAEEIQKDWRNAFKKETWLDGVIFVGIMTVKEFEQHSNIVHRMNPQTLGILNDQNVHDLSALKGLTRVRLLYFLGGANLTNVDALMSLPALESVWLDGCTGLTNLDALKSHPALKRVTLSGCTSLTNVDVLKSLPALQEVEIIRCTGLTKESIAALRAALPNARVFTD